ncbi:MAG TPA: TIGR03619 family F420-dependent LLM class oxidoreductase [Acidimicrobiales bacterium]|nr:TIGR03619 family F420-dependent LLM class oxidoreductase [Acidimicrobiales bacterium]
MRPQISLHLPSFAREDPGDWDHLVRFAQSADEAGVDRLVVSDHVVFGENLGAYGDPALGGATGATQPTGPDGAWLEPLVTIAHLTAVTRRTRFGTSVLIAALRRPVVLAKMVASVDVLSGGRFDLGVGVGWQREEYDAAGVPFGSRGKVLDRSLEICQLLWGTPRAGYEVEGRRVEGIHQMPKPRQPGGVPIWVSGTTGNDRAMDRLARFGVGWIPWGEDAAHVGDGIRRMRAALRRRDRDPTDVQVVGSVPAASHPDGTLDVEQTLLAVPRLRRAGVTDFRLLLRGHHAASDVRSLSAVVTGFRHVAGEG